MRSSKSIHAQTPVAAFSGTLARMMRRRHCDLASTPACSCVTCRCRRCTRSAQCTSANASSKAVPPVLEGQALGPPAAGQVTCLAIDATHCIIQPLELAAGRAGAGRKGGGLVTRVYVIFEEHTRAGRTLDIRVELLQ